jgi:sigma-B regulation protein RsbU (phosphoserine phosphatase)
VDPALGLFPSTEYHQQAAHMEPGDAIVFYTDGIVEAENADTDSFDTTRLGQSLCRHVGQDVSGMLEGLVTDVQVFSGRKRFDDDVCLVGMKLRNLLDKRDA